MKTPQDFEGYDGPRLNVSSAERVGGFEASLGYTGRRLSQKTMKEMRRLAPQQYASNTSTRKARAKLSSSLSSPTSQVQSQPGLQTT